MTPKFVFSIISILLASGLTSCSSDPTRGIVGKPFPNFSLALSGTESDTFRSTEQLKGHASLLVFWATWCPPCRGELKDLKLIQSRYEAHGLKVVALSIDDDPAQSVPVLSAAHPNYIGLVGAKDLFRDLKLESVPQGYLLDSSGHVVETFYGTFEPREPEASIDKLLR